MANLLRVNVLALQYVIIQQYLIFGHLDVLYKRAR